MDKNATAKKIAFALLFLGVSGALGYFIFQNHTQTEQIRLLLEERAHFIAEQTSSSRNYLTEREIASSTIAELSAQLALTKEELENTERDLRREENRNEDFEDQIEAISGTVEILDRLSKTDEELLKKYSSTYFLNENFVPMKLAKIDSKYVLPGRKDQYFHGDAIKFLYDMLDEAESEGLDLKVLSAYRSFDEQQALKSQYTQIFGSGANAFSADQGYSEHQLGTAVDVSDSVTAGAFTAFAQTKEYQWLLENAHKYGFILSYPENNRFFVFEPWHWRFVGVGLATDLHRQNKSFYDLDQRELDAYLISIFD